MVGLDDCEPVVDRLHSVAAIAWVLWCELASSF